MENQNYQPPEQTDDQAEETEFTSADATPTPAPIAADTADTDTPDRGDEGEPVDEVQLFDPDFAHPPQGLFGESEGLDTLFTRGKFWAWTLFYEREDKKPKKPPVSRDGIKISDQNGYEGQPYKEVLKICAVLRERKPNDYFGVGLLMDSVPDIFVIDLDNCMNPNTCKPVEGLAGAAARTVLEAADTLVMWSTSSTGLHVFYRKNEDTILPDQGPKSTGIEVFPKEGTRKRDYIALGGKIIVDMPIALAGETVAEIIAFQTTVREAEERSENAERDKRNASDAMALLRGRGAPPQPAQVDFTSRGGFFRNANDVALSTEAHVMCWLPKLRSGDVEKRKGYVRIQPDGYNNGITAHYGASENAGLIVHWENVDALIRNMVARADTRRLI